MRNQKGNWNGQHSPEMGTKTKLLIMYVLPSVQSECRSFQVQCTKIDLSSEQRHTMLSVALSNENITAMKILQPNTAEYSKNWVMLGKKIFMRSKGSHWAEWHVLHNQSWISTMQIYVFITSPSSLVTQVCVTPDNTGSSVGLHSTIQKFKSVSISKKLEKHNPVTSSVYCRVKSNKHKTILLEKKNLLIMINWQCQTLSGCQLTCRKFWCYLLCGKSRKKCTYRPS